MAHAGLGLNSNNNMRPVHQGGDVRHLLGGGGDDQLQAQFPGQLDALLGALVVHLIEGLIEYNQAHGLVIALHPGPVDMGEGGQDCNVEGVLGLAAGALAQHLAEPGFVALIIGGDQVELQVFAVVGELLQILLQLSSSVTVEQVVFGHNLAEKVFQGFFVLLLEGPREEIIALEEESLRRFFS